MNIYLVIYWSDIEVSLGKNEYTQLPKIVSVPPYFAS